MTISVIQERSNSAGSPPVATYSLAFSSNITAGSALHVIGVIGDSSTTMTCADSLNGSYGAALDTLTAPNGNTAQQFVFSNSASGANTVTLTFSLTKGFPAIWIKEIGSTSGFDVHAAQEQTTPGTGTGIISSSAATPTVQPGLCSAVCFDVIAASTPIANTGAGFTDAGAGILWGGATNAARSEYLRYTSLSSLAATFTSTTGAADQFCTFAAFFKESAAGGTAPFTPFTQTQFFVTETIIQQ